MYNGGQGGLRYARDNAAPGPVKVVVSMHDVVAASRGPIALVGSGEYLPQMEGVDRVLLEQVGGQSARVVVLATAAGLEPPASPRRWARMGVEHFARLGVRAEPVDILDRSDAFDGRWLPSLEAADFIYFSGGDPVHVVETLQDSPAWQVIHARHADGAVLAGCSAGAMALGGATLQRGTLRSAAPVSDHAPTWRVALGIVPGVIVLPHFDRLGSRMGKARLASIAASVPEGRMLIGIDEDTALVCLNGNSALGAASEWRVMGRQGVSVLHAEHAEVRYLAGATLRLESG
jgi:cyanophycinase